MRHGSYLTELGIRVEVGDDVVTATMPLTAAVSNPRGAIQGGLIATLIDITGGILATRGLPPEVGMATADLSVHFLRPVATGPARAVATLLRRGQRSTVVRVEVTDAGREVLAAVATVTFSALKFRDGQADPSRPRLDVTAGVTGDVTSDVTSD